MSKRDGLPICIGERRYMGDTSAIGLEPLSSMRQQVDQTGEPSDASLDNQGIWRRHQVDWSLGAGQDHFDDVNGEPSRRRFRWNRGVDVWDPRQLTLLPDSVLVESITGHGSPDSAQSGRMKATDLNTVHAVVGSKAIRIDRSSDTSWSTTELTMPVGTGILWDIASFNGKVYLTSFNGALLVLDSLTDTTADVVTDVGARLVTVFSGRMVLAGINSALSELNADGTTTPIWTHPGGTSWFSWTRLHGTAQGIYAFGKDRSGVWGYRLNVNEADGAFAPPSIVLRLDPAETINDVAQYGDVLILATEKGIRLAAINADGSLTAGGLIEFERGVKCVTVDGDYAWFGWSKHRYGYIGLGRLDPRKFVEEPWIPAHAADLMVSGGGHYTLGVASIYGQRCFLLDTATGSVDLYRQSTDKVTFGELYTGGIDFGTPERKVVHSIEGKWKPLPAGARVEVDLFRGLEEVGKPDNSDWESAGVDNSDFGGTTERSPLTPEMAEETVEVRLRLHRGTDASTGPTLLRWSLRALVQPYRTHALMLNVIISERVAWRPNGTGQEIVVPMNPIEELDYLRGLEQSGELIDVRVGGMIHERCRLDAVALLPNEMAGVEGWNKDGSMDAVWTLRFLTIEPQEL